MCTEKHLLYSHIQIQKKKKERKTSAILKKKEKECEIHTHDVCQTRTEKIVQCRKKFGGIFSFAIYFSSHS
jgi:hypothetical protein